MKGAAVSATNSRWIDPYRGELHAPPMNIAILGAGRIGSAFAFRLSRAGHDVTMVARGNRLQELMKSGAIVDIEGQRGNVKVETELNSAVSYDLVLVTVMAHQVEALLPALRASSAKKVLFMFNTFEKGDRWREAIGPTRFEQGFPNMIAFFEGEKLRSVVDGPGNVTTLSSPEWARILREAGLPTEVEPDMPSFLRSHVAFFLPLMVAALWVCKRAQSLTWAEAKTLTAVLIEALDVVKGLGHTLKPGFVALMRQLPSFVLTLMLWASARMAAVKDLGAFGPSEARELIDAMAAAAPGKTPKLLAIRP